MFEKNTVSKEEKKRILEYIKNRTWEDIVENSTIHFIDLDPKDFKHREKKGEEN